MQKIIAYGRQHIDDDDIEEVVKALKSDFLTCGPYVEQFEQALCDVTGAKYAVACNSGTAALHLAMLALGITEGDAVIVPTITFLATANAVRYCGANVIFADVDPITGLMTPQTLKAAYDKAETPVKAAIVVHLSGQCAELSALKSFCDEHNIAFLEDACHALGGKNVGACQNSIMSTFSFHPVKTIAMGEGGAITTNNQSYADTMRQYRSHGMIRGDHWKYSMQDLGYNYRTPDLNCALGLSQLKKLDKFTKRRLEIAKRYDAFFKTINWATPVITLSDSETYHLYPILVDFAHLKMTREELMDGLREKGIGTQVHYIPVHSQPYYGGNLDDLPGASEYYQKTLSLPIFYDLTDAQLSYILEVLGDY